MDSRALPVGEAAHGETSHASSNGRRAPSSSTVSSRLRLRARSLRSRARGSLLAFVRRKISGSKATLYCLEILRLSFAI